MTFFYQKPIWTTCPHYPCGCRRDRGAYQWNTGVTAHWCSRVRFLVDLTFRLKSLWLKVSPYVSWNRICPALSRSKNEMTYIVEESFSFINRWLRSGMCSRGDAIVKTQVSNSSIFLLLAKVVETQELVLLLRAVVRRSKDFVFLSRESSVRESSGAVLGSGLGDKTTMIIYCSLICPGSLGL